MGKARGRGGQGGRERRSRNPGLLCALGHSPETATNHAVTLPVSEPHLIRATPYHLATQVCCGRSCILIHVRWNGEVLGR
jgi:hypothetical protein